MQECCQDFGIHHTNVLLDSLDDLTEQAASFLLAGGCGERSSKQKQPLGSGLVNSVVEVPRIMESVGEAQNGLKQGLTVDAIVVIGRRRSD